MKKCEHCGSRITPRKENLSKGLLVTLDKFIKAIHRKERNSIHLQTEMPELTKNEYNNFQKLRYHGLVHNRDQKPGYWFLTRKGSQFLKGEVKTVKTVYVLDNRIVGKGDYFVGVRDYPELEDYWQKDFSVESSKQAELL